MGLACPSYTYYGRTAMQKIVPHLWFDKEAIEAAKLYTSIFDGSKVVSTSKMEGTPSGTVEMASISLSGQEFSLLSAGPLFKFTPALSFLVACDTKEEAGRLWEALREKGDELMPLGEYPFSEKYGWLTDRYGLSWQIMYSGGKEVPQKITPSLMFVGEQCGRAEEALRFYASVFGGASVDGLRRYGSGEAPDREGELKFGAFTLEGQRFSAMDSAYDHGFSFNEAVSLMVFCENQEEIDHYWKELSAHPEAEQCGWLKDRYGLSWQIVPRVLGEMMGDKDPAKAKRVQEAFLAMKKFDIAKLERAFEGR
jgi:predicted 3-demethylubiquinone-9 3-methyltransferase (glyoxalase superfamily)